MQNSTNMRILELLRFLYERTDENHPATVSDIIAHLNGKGIQAVRQTVYADTNALIDAGIDIVVVKSTQNQYFMGSRPFEYNGNVSSDESHGIIERQADTLASALLMPLPQIKKCFYRLRIGRTDEQLIAEMANIFEVSKQAMQIRLKSRNLI